MKESSADFTNTFRLLCEVVVMESDDKRDEDIVKLFTGQCQSASDLKKKDRSGIDTQQLEMMIMIAQRNPAVLQQIGVTMEQLQNEVKRAKENMAKGEMTQEEKIEKDQKLWSSWIEKYRKRLLKEFETVGEEEKREWFLKRVSKMKEHNPKFILRNHIAQNAIKAAEGGDYSEVRRVLTILQNPYSDDVQFDLKEKNDVNSTEESDVNKSKNETLVEAAQACSSAADTSDSTSLDRYACKPPSWAMDLRVT